MGFLCFGKNDHEAIKSNTEVAKVADALVVTDSVPAVVTDAAPAISPEVVAEVVVA